jgi:hypothetical protein
VVATARSRSRLDGVVAVIVGPETVPDLVIYGLALLPPLAISLVFFRQLAGAALGLALGIAVVLMLAEALLGRAGIIITPGRRRAHPAAITALLVAGFAAPRLPLPVIAGAVAATILFDRIVGPRLPATFPSPALLGIAAVALLQQPLHVSYTNPFDLRPLAEPFALAAETHRTIDPIKLYVGNVPGPLAATSMGAVLLGWAYLGYARRVLGRALAAYLVGVAMAALVLRQDVPLQIVSGPALFVTAFVASDRRYLQGPSVFLVALGLVAGILTVALRMRAQHMNAAWEAWIAVGLVASLFLWVWARLPPGLRITRGPTPAPVPPEEEGLGEAPAPAMPARLQRYPSGPALRQGVRLSQVHRPVSEWTAQRYLVLALLLMVVNPVGLVMLRGAPLRPAVRLALTVASLLWYAAVAFVLLRVLRRI